MTNHENILSQLFENQVEKNSNKVALHFENQKLTYKELNKKANQLAHYFKNLGITNNDLIAFSLYPSFEILIVIMGILKAGAAYIPIDPDNPLGRQLYILENSKAKLLITESKTSHHFKSYQKEILVLDRSSTEIKKFPTTNPTITNSETDLAYVIYTSGSTGKPKGVMITHRNVTTFVTWFSDAIKNGHTPLFDFSSSISFDFAVSNTLFPLLIGAEIAICPYEKKRDPFLYIEHLIKNKVTILKIVPSHFRELKEAIFSEKPTLHLETVVFGGERLYAQDIEDWLQQYPNQSLLCEYGPCEATVATSWIKINKDNISHYKTIIPIGKPAINTQLYIFDKKMNPAKEGELYIGGQGVAKGYLYNQELTDQQFIPNPLNKTEKLYKTGDICRYLPDGNIEFIARADDQIKIRGFRIELGEIENYLLAHPEISNAAIIIKKDLKKVDEKKIIAFCVVKNKAISTLDLKKYLENFLPYYMIPLILLIDEIPLAASGKVDRIKLANMKLPFREGSQPTTEIQSILKKIWLETLNTEHIHFDDNFFELGGDSLLATRILIKIKKTLHKQLELKELYDFPTIHELSKIIENKQLSIKKLPIPVDLRLNKNQLPLSELQFVFWLMKTFYSTATLLNITKRITLNGHINVGLLQLAADSILKRHSILAYNIAVRPYQYKQKIQHLPLEHIDIQSITVDLQKKELQKSFNELYHWQWKKNHPLIKFKLYLLKENKFELQIATSHFISDEISLNLILLELSEYYLLYSSNQAPAILPEFYFKNYVIDEIKSNLNQSNQNRKFWEKYFKNTFMVTTQSQFSADKNENSLTSYLEIPDINLEALKQFCLKNQVSLTTMLCSIIGVGLMPYVSLHNNILPINLIKSTRVSEKLDTAVGPFLRTDLINIDLTDTTDNLEIAKKIQSEIAKTFPYQSCPTIVKLACLLKKNWQRKKINIIFIEIITKLMSSFFKKYYIQKQDAKMFGLVFSSLKKNQILVDINITHKFLFNHTLQNLFACNIERNNPDFIDRIVEKRVLNIWLDKLENDKDYIIISGNFTKEFRDSIGQNIIKIISKY